MNIFLLKEYLTDISELKVGIDCSNGNSSLYIHDLFEDLPDYINISFENSGQEKNYKQISTSKDEPIKKLIRDKNLDIGIVFNHSGENVYFIDENTEVISPDLIVAVLAHYFIAQEKGKIVQNIKASKSVKDYLTKFGAEIVFSENEKEKIIEKLTEVNGIYASDGAGGYFFNDQDYAGSALFASIIVLNILVKLKNEGLGLSDMINHFNYFPFTKSIELEIIQPEDIISDIKGFYSSEERPASTIEHNGARLEFENWWFYISAKGEKLEFYAEARTRELLEEKLAVFNNIINRLDKPGDSLKE
ncbi:hypothetical protein ACFLTI_10605 [Bacteroidota bacterium]